MATRTRTEELEQVARTLEGWAESERDRPYQRHGDVPAQSLGAARAANFQELADRIRDAIEKEAR